MNAISQLRDEKELRGNIQKQLNESKVNIDGLKSTVEKLQHDIKVLQDSQLYAEPILVKKKWSDLRDKGTKCRRKKMYKSILDRSMRCITECTQAKLTLGLDDANLDIVWTENEMNTHRKDVGVRNSKYNLKTSRVHSFPDRRIYFRRPIKRLSKFKRKEGIFNAKCKLSDSHIRRVVSVLDENRISHEAYQCIRNVCMGHMPSLNQIKFQKKVMSHQLPVVGDNMVSIGCLAT